MAFFFVLIRSGWSRRLADPSMTLPQMLYAILCYNSEEVVTSWTKEEDDAVMARLNIVHEKWEKAGKLKRIPFADRAAMKKAVDPVMADYAKEIGADAIYAKINAM